MRLHTCLTLAPAVVLAALTLSNTSQAATGLKWIDSNTNLTFTADIRLRYEVDWDSQNAAGVQRDDRHRGRIRARLGAGYAITDEWSIGARIRTGSSDSQQSPHLTFVTDDGDADSIDFVADRYYLQFKRGSLLAWGGRNTTPFWQQNELFWDEDVTPTGLAVSYDQKLDTGTLTGTAGAFYLPDGGYGLNGQMLAGQVKYALPVKPSQFIVAAGMHYMNGEEGASQLRNGNGDRDYIIGVASAQWSMPIQGKTLAIGADLYRNFESYTADTVAPLAANNTNERLGYVLSIQLGQLKQAHDWQIGYYYAHIETLAVNGSYAQDDWIRFGNGPQTDASDFKGHEIRLGYAVSKNINLLARLYIVEAITSVQDGNRFRLDFNWKF